MTGLESEVSALTSFLTRRYPSEFARLSPELLETDARWAFLIASVVTDAFFLRRRSGEDEVGAYPVRLEPGLCAPWARDIEGDYHELVRGRKKVVKFFQSSLPMAGYSGRGSEHRMVAKETKMLQSLAAEVERRMGRGLSDVLLVPYYWYGKGGLQFGEPIYHFLAGLVLRDAGYLVIDEYAPSLVTGTARTPDLSAFRTPELVDMMKELRAAGVISSGAFLQELQLYSLFGRQRQAAAPRSGGLTDAETVAVEVKRSESPRSIKKGSEQLADYLSEAYGFYDEGYLSGPFIEGPGTISLRQDGKVSFERPAPSTSAIGSDYWRERKALQLLDVRAAVVLQLLKNVGLSEMVSVCGGGTHGVETYENLAHALQEVAMEDVIRSLRPGNQGG